MKKRTLVNLVLLTLLMFNESIAQEKIAESNGKDKIIFSNWINPMTLQAVDFEKEMTVILFPGDELHVYLKTSIAPVATVTNFPLLYIEYAFGTETGIIGPLKDQDFESITLPGNQESALQASFFKMFQFSEACTEDKDGIIELPVSFALVTPDGGSYIPYPVLDHSKLFPLDWFSETTLPSPPAPAFNDTKFIDCALTPTIENKTAAPQEKVPTDLAFSLTTVQPNPFVDDLQLTYQLNRPSTLDIKVLDAYGRLLFEYTTLRKEIGKHFELLPLEHLPPGLYYLQLNAADDSQITKVIKN